ncbi:MAG: hypothetical protein ACOYM0_01050 [Bacteroidales bacterium]
MKNLFLLITILLAGICTNAQKIDDCYINTRTGDTILTTLWENVVYTDENLLTLRMVKQNSSFYIEFKFNFGKSPSFSITRNDSVWLKFTDNLTLSLYSVDSVTSQRGMAACSVSPKGLTTQGITARYNLTFLQVMILQSQEIEKVRIFTSRGFDNIMIPKSQRKSIMGSAELITRRVDQYLRVSITDKQNKKVSEEPKDTSW